jgi:hypothetical protein
MISEASILSSKIYNQKRKPLYMSQIKGDTLYLYFKGCCTWKDYISSIDTRSCKVMGDIMTIHNGYYDIYKNNENDIESTVLKALDNHPISHLVYCGHSAGGALSQITSIFLHGKIKSDEIKTHCYTFGTPKAGDDAFVSTVKAVTGSDQYVRVEMYDDIVPILPIHSFFVHGGLPLILTEERLNNKPIKGADFYIKYHTNIPEFINDMRHHDLFNTKDVLKMIESHRCENYVKGFAETFFKGCRFISIDKVCA